MPEINLMNFSEELEALLNQKSEEIFDAIEEGLDKAEDLMLAALKAGSPRGTGDYANNWKPKRARDGRPYKKNRYIHNTKIVEWGDVGIPLSAILERSSVHGKPHINRIKNKMKPQIIQAIKDAVEKVS